MVYGQGHLPENQDDNCGHVIKAATLKFLTHPVDDPVIDPKLLKKV